MNDSAETQTEDAVDRQKMLDTLHGITGTLVTGYGCFDTGIEFRVLTAFGAAFVIGPGRWPISGPFSYNAHDRAIGKTLLKLEISNQDLDAESINEMLVENGSRPLSKKAMDRFHEIDSALYLPLIKLARAGWKPRVSFFVYQGESPDDFSVWETEEEALQAFLEDSVEFGQPWEKMADGELEEYLDYMEQADYHLDFTVEMKENQCPSPSAPARVDPPQTTALEPIIITFSKQVGKVLGWIARSHPDKSAGNCLNELFYSVCEGDRFSVEARIAECVGKVDPQIILLAILAGISSAYETVQSGQFSFPELLISIQSARAGIVKTGLLINKNKPIAVIGRVGTPTGMFPEFFLDSENSIQRNLLEAFGFQVIELREWAISERDLEPLVVNALSKHEVSVISLCVKDYAASLLNLPARMNNYGFANIPIFLYEYNLFLNESLKGIITQPWDMLTTCCKIQDLDLPEALV